MSSINQLQTNGLSHQQDINADSYYEVMRRHHAQQREHEEWMKTVDAPQIHHRRRRRSGWNLGVPKFWEEETIHNGQRRDEGDIWRWCKKLVKSIWEKIWSRMRLGILSLMLLGLLLALIMPSLLRGLPKLTLFSTPSPLPQSTSHFTQAKQLPRQDMWLNLDMRIGFDFYLVPGQMNNIRKDMKTIIHTINVPKYKSFPLANHKNYSCYAEEVFKTAREVGKDPLKTAVNNTIMRIRSAAEEVIRIQHNSGLTLANIAPFHANVTTELESISNKARHLQDNLIAMKAPMSDLHRAVNSDYGNLEAVRWWHWRSSEKIRSWRGMLDVISARVNSSSLEQGEVIPFFECFVKSVRSCQRNATMNLMKTLEHGVGIDIDRALLERVQIVWWCVEKLRLR